MQTKLYNSQILSAMHWHPCSLRVSSLSPIQCNTVIVIPSPNKLAKQTSREMHYLHWQTEDRKHRNSFI